jgi:hypothetical protein
MMHHEKLQDQAEEHNGEMGEVFNRLQASMDINRLLQIKLDRQEKLVESISSHFREQIGAKNVLVQCHRSFLGWKQLTKVKLQARQTVNERHRFDASFLQLKVLKGWHMYAARQTYSKECGRTLNEREQEHQGQEDQLRARLATCEGQLAKANAALAMGQRQQAQLEESLRKAFVDGMTNLQAQTGNIIGRSFYNQPYETVAESLRHGLGEACGGFAQGAHRQDPTPDIQFDDVSVDRNVALEPAWITNPYDDVASTPSKNCNIDIPSPSASGPVPVPEARPRYPHIMGQVTGVGVASGGFNAAAPQRHEGFPEPPLLPAQDPVVVNMVTSQSFDKDFHQCAAQLFPKRLPAAAAAATTAVHANTAVPQYLHAPHVSLSRNIPHRPQNGDDEDDNKWYVIHMQLINGWAQASRDQGQGELLNPIQPLLTTPMKKVDGGREGGRNQRRRRWKGMPWKEGRETMEGERKTIEGRQEYNGRKEGRKEGMALLE